MTLLELSDTDAQSFLLFMKHKDTFELLLTHQVFDVKNGTAELHFNPSGTLMTIDLHAKVFKRAVKLDEPVAIVKEVL